MHVFEDATGRRRKLAISGILLVLIGLTLLAGEFVLRLHQLPSLADRGASSGVYEGTTAHDGDDPSDLAFPQPDRLTRLALTRIGELSLTFDGLPPREELPELLTLLERSGVEATFFVDGPAMLERGDALRPLTESGHIIGMLHSQPEPRLTSIIFGPRLIDNATQLMIVRETGTRTLIARARPGDSLPLSPESLAAHDAQLASGYLPVAAGYVAPHGALDPQDFVEGLLGVQGDEVLRFDLRADNASHVISALPEILSQLEAEGARFQPFRLAHDLSRGEAMPLSTVDSKGRDAIAFGMMGFIQFGLTVVFLSMMGIAALRSLTFLALALARGRRTGFDPVFQPHVTVIVPAYNEVAVIERCIVSLLEQDYPNIDVVIVVNDGSTDRTAQVVRENFGDHPRVTLIEQENFGKWSAANYALSIVTTPIFVIADADSLFPQDTVSWLVQQFKDERVGAVSGLVEVGNYENLLSDFQRIEYIVSQNVMRRAYETFEGILVVPGAVGAWRTEAVRRAHEFSGDTLTEDADLTVAVHRAGYRVRFQEQARSVTEAPSTVRGFLRQRLRWTFGMLQAAWKHRGAITEGRSVGLISIVDSIAFGLASSILSPLVDLLLLIILVQGVITLASGAEMSLAGFPTVVLLSYLFLIILDLLNTLAAFRFERRFDLKLLLLVPLLRFGYRQLLYYSTLRAIWHAITGRMAAWNKLERTAAAFANSSRGIWNSHEYVLDNVPERETAR